MTLLVGDEFEALFRTFEHSAFRLETREHYGVSYEREPYEHFLSQGTVGDLAFMDGWVDYIRSIFDEGKLFQRVRVVSKPWSDYTQFGLALSNTNVGAGEDIRYLLRDEAGADGLPGHDFWLFDNSRLVVLHFDDDSDLLGAEPIDDPAVIVRHCYWRDASRHIATPFAEFTKTHGVQYPTGA